MKGLSPRVRGNRFAAAPDVLRSRSIPACAGEPKISLLISFFLSVYPRVCGGTSGVPAHSPLLWGLSPRVRGNHSHCKANQWRRRSIPACAGEPYSTICRVGAARVYPRVCGETFCGSRP